MPKVTPQQHAELAGLLNQAAECLRATVAIVKRAPFSDRYLYVGGTLQEWLIDPLRQEWDDAELPYRENPYQSVAYGGPHRRKKPPAKSCVPK